MCHWDNSQFSANIISSFSHLQEQSSSEEIGGEASDVLSAISNEECSVASEIFDKPEGGQNLGDILQVNRKINKEVQYLMLVF